MEAFKAGLREHVASKPRAKVTLILDIWAEAARNQTIAAISRAVDDEILKQIEAMIDIAKARGEAQPSVDSAFVARFVFTYVSGLLKRLALEPGFDPDAESAQAFDLIKLLCDGGLEPAAEESAP